MENKLTIGEVLKPQGIRGELKVKPYTDTAENFSGLKRVFLDGEEFKVLSVRTGGGLVFLGLRGVCDRNAAELLRGKQITIPREEAPDPGEGRYYVADLLGCEIFTEEGKRLGLLKEITQAATDVYTMETEKGNVLFPALKEVIALFCPEKKRIVVSEKRFWEVAVF